MPIGRAGTKRVILVPSKGPLETLMRVIEGVGELNIFIGSNFVLGRKGRMQKICNGGNPAPPDGTRTFGPVTFSNDASIYFTRFCDIDAPRK
jgi:hypothetical protein